MSDLRHSLKLDIRCGPGSTEQQQQSAAALIALLTNTYPQFSDWKELVKGDGQADVQRCMKENADLMKAEKMPDMGGVILAPEGMFFFRPLYKLSKLSRQNKPDGQILTRPPFSDTLLRHA